MRPASARLVEDPDTVLATLDRNLLKAARTLGFAVAGGP